MARQRPLAEVGIDGKVIHARYLLHEEGAAQAGGNVVEVDPSQGHHSHCLVRSSYRVASEGSRRDRRRPLTGGA